METLPAWLAGKIARYPQDDLPGEVSMCRLIKKEDGRIDWTRPAAHIERMMRAYTPWPAAYSTWRGEIFKVLAAGVLPGRAEAGRITATPQGPAVGTGDGLLLLQSVQAAGKKAMPAAAFAHGAQGFVGGKVGRIGRQQRETCPRLAAREGGKGGERGAVGVVQSCGGGRAILRRRTLCGIVSFASGRSADW